MGWWKTVNGDVIGDAPANYVDELVERGIAYTEPSELPVEVRKRIVSLYVEELGREPSESEIRTLLAFCLG